MQEAISACSESQTPSESLQGEVAHQEGLHEAQLEEGAAGLVVAARHKLAAGAAALEAAVAAPVAQVTQQWSM